MKKIFLLHCFLFLFLGFCYSQSTPHFMNPEGYDSLGREQGHWKLITALNFMSRGQIVKGIEAWEYGFFIDGQKEGGWDVKDEEGKLIGHRVYKNGVLICEIQYGKNQKVSSIIRSESKKAPSNADGIDSYGEYVDIISFKRNGKLQKRYYKIKEEVIIEQY